MASIGMIASQSQALGRQLNDALTTQGIKFAELKVAGLEAVGVRYAGYKWVFPRQPGAQVETYDLGADPGEQRDVGGSDLRERGEALAAQYATLVSSATTALASAPGVPAAPPAPPLDERTVQKLRALGYVQ